MFINLIDSFELHVSYMQSKKVDIKKIKENIKNANKLKTIVASNTYKVLALYAPTSIKLMQTMVYIKASMSLKEIIRKSQDIFKDVDSNDKKERNKDIIAIEIEAIKVLKKTSFMITHLSNNEKISEYYKDIGQDIKDNLKKYKKMKSTILKTVKKNKTIVSDLESIYHLQALLDIENQCLCIASSVKNNTSKL